jgi:hypothetical protein
MERREFITLLGGCRRGVAALQNQSWQRAKI